MLHTETQAKPEKTYTLREQDLRQFTGTEAYYHLPIFKRYVYTDGVRHVAQTGGAYWLIEKIFACQSCVPGLSQEEICFWSLTLNAEGKGAQLVCTDGNYKNLYSENIVFTDFPLKKIRFYFQNNVLFLPSEY